MLGRVVSEQVGELACATHLGQLVKFFSVHSSSFFLLPSSVNLLFLFHAGRDRAQQSATHGWGTLLATKTERSSSRFAQQVRGISL